MGSENDQLSRVSCFAHNIPQVPFCHWVHAGCWFVQVQDSRVSDQGNGRAQFPFVSTAKIHINILKNTKILCTNSSILLKYFFSY